MKSFLEIVVNYRHTHPNIEYKDCELAWAYYEYQQEISATQALIRQKKKGGLANGLSLQTLTETLREIRNHPVRITHNAKKVYEECLFLFEKQLKAAS